MNDVPFLLRATTTAADQAERDARALSEEGPACITNTRHSTGLGRGHALGRGSQDSTVDP